MDIEIELLSGELQVFKDTLLKLTCRFKRIEGFLSSQFGSEFDEFESVSFPRSVTREPNCGTEKIRLASTSAPILNIPSDSKDSSDSDSESDADSDAHVQSDKERESTSADIGSNEKEGTRDEETLAKRRRGRPRKHPPKAHEVARGDKRCRPAFVKWILYKTFNDADEAEAYILSEEQIWSKSFMNKSQQGKKQYFGCRVTRRCPARRALFYRNDSTFLLYKSERGHDHSGVKASRLKRFANILSYEEIEASISVNAQQPSGSIDDQFMDQQLLEMIDEETLVPSNITTQVNSIT